MAEILFYILAAFAVFSAIAAITRIDALSSALWLISALLAVGCLYGTLSAPLIAALQVLVAAGAVMVLILFVIMLVDRRAEVLRPRMIRFGKIVGFIAAAYLAIVMSVAVAEPPFNSAPDTGAFYDSPITLARLMMERYALPFELTGVLMLVAVVAAVVIAKRTDAAEVDEDIEELIA